MKVLWIAVITASALTASSQSVPTSSSGQVVSDTDASSLAGTDVVAELSKSLSVKKLKPGDPVKGRVAQDVISHGKIVIRRGSKLVGHVIEAKVRTKDDHESRLAVVFDKAVLKGGKEINFSAALRALAPPMRLGSVDRPDQMAPPTMGPLNGPSGAQPISGGATTPTRGSPGMPAGSSAATDSTAINAASRAATYSAAAAGNSGVGENGLISGGSRGVFGLRGLHLALAPGGLGVIISNTENVKLDGGTQMVLQVK